MNRVVYAIVLERNKGILPGGIRFFMNIWGKITKKGRKPEYNHAEILIWVERLGLLTVGAVKNGFKARPFKDTMPKKHWKNLELYVTRTPLTEEQEKKIFDAVVHYSLGYQHRPYEFSNFPSWIVKILTFGKVNLSKDSDKRMECYEAVARCYNAAGDYFPNPEYTDIYDFTNNIHLKPLDNWEEMICELL